MTLACGFFGLISCRIRPPLIPADALLGSPSILEPLELLDADYVRVDDLHGLHHLVVQELPHRPGALDALLDGLLDGDELVALLRDHGLDLAAVGGRLVELLPQAELELHRLERRRRLDAPVAVALGHLEIEKKK